jgi:hypothetical protein
MAAKKLRCKGMVMPFRAVAAGALHRRARRLKDCRGNDRGGLCAKPGESTGVDTYPSSEARHGLEQASAKGAFIESASLSPMARG